MVRDARSAVFYVANWNFIDRSEDYFAESVTSWATTRGIEQADIDQGLNAVVDILRQRGASIVRVAELNLECLRRTARAGRPR